MITIAPSHNHVIGGSSMPYSASLRRSSVRLNIGMPPKQLVRSTAPLKKALKKLSSRLSTPEEKSRNSASKLLSSLFTSSEISSTPEEKSRNSASKLLSSLLTSSEISSQQLKEITNESSEKGVPSARDVAKEISLIVSQEGNDGEQPFPLPTQDTNKEEEAHILSLSWFSNALPTVSEKRRKELHKERKARWVRKNSQNLRFNTLLTKCAEKLGTESTFEILSILGRETGIKECNSLINIYLNEARKCHNLQDSLVRINKVYSIFKFMSEKGLQIEAMSYEPLLMYLIDMKMTEEFLSFSDFIKKEVPSSQPRLGYYQMLLYIKVGNEAKIQELCNHIEVDNDEEDAYKLAENYLMAFCFSDRKIELLQFLEVLDINTVSSLKHVACIFKSLGRLSLDELAKRFLLSLKTKGKPEDEISSVIYDYVSSIPDLEVDETVSQFISMHLELGLKLSNAAYDKLILMCCSLSKVHVAVDIVNQGHTYGWVPSLETFSLLLSTIDHCGEFNLIHQIYSLMRQHSIVPTDDIIRSLINSYTRLKDFESAHNLIKDLEEGGIKATTGIYNALIAGYFREQNKHGALMVLKQMKKQNVQLDAETFGYLISNSTCKKEVMKFYDEMKQSGVQANKLIFMALINAFANCGMFDEAKQVIVDHDIPVKHLNAIRSVLVSALASNGRTTDALEVYSEMQRTGCHFQLKAACYLIEYIRSEGKINRLLKLLEDLHDTKFWFDGSIKVLLYCIRYDLLEPAVELLKQMKEKDENALYFVIDQAFCQVWENEVPNVEVGLKLLQFLKVDLRLQPSRTSLDFLLSTCVKAKDKHSAQLVWSEYKMSNIQYNVLTLLRMYQALLSSKDLSASKILWKLIPRDDPHVCLVLNACQSTY